MYPIPDGTNPNFLQETLEPNPITLWDTIIIIYLYHNKN